MRESVRDHLHHTIQIRIHIAIPESQDAKTLLPKPRIANVISLRSMLTAVNFDNQPCLQTNESTT